MTTLPTMAMLYGAKEISEYLFGRPDRTDRVYDMRRRTDIPLRKSNGTLCVIVLELNDWLARLPAANSNEPLAANSNDAVREEDPTG